MNHEKHKNLNQHLTLVETRGEIKRKYTESDVLLDRKKLLDIKQSMRSADRNDTRAYNEAKANGEDAKLPPFEKFTLRREGYSHRDGNDRLHSTDVFELTEDSGPAHYYFFEPSSEDALIDTENPIIESEDNDVVRLFRDTLGRFPKRGGPVEYYDYNSELWDRTDMPMEYVPKRRLLAKRALMAVVDFGRDNKEAFIAISKSDEAADAYRDKLIKRDHDKLNELDNAAEQRGNAAR